MTSTPLGHPFALRPPSPGSLAGAVAGRNAGTGWFTPAALAFAVLALGLALQVNFGQYHPAAMPWLTIALLACVAAAALPNFGRLTVLNWRPDQLILAVALAVQFALLYSHDPAATLRLDNPDDHLPFKAGIALAAALTAVGVSGTRAARAAVPLLLLTHLALGVWVIHLAPMPRVDVQVFQHDAAAALLAGRNPYAITFPDVYDGHAPGLYGPGLATDGRLNFGYPYLPLSLLLALPGHLLGDFRYAHLLALTLAGGLIAYARPGGCAEATRGQGDKQTRGQGDKQTRGQGDTETRGQGDTGTRGQGDTGTRGQGDTGTRRQEGSAEGIRADKVRCAPAHRRPAERARGPLVPLSPCPLVSSPRCPLVPLSLPRVVPLSPRPLVSSPSPSSTARSVAAAALLLFTPRGFFVIEAGWTEPFAILMLAATVFVAGRKGLRWAALLPVTLGLLFACKQYLVLAAPLVLLLPAALPASLPGVRGLAARRLAMLVMALLVAAAVSLPIMLWDIEAFRHSAVTLQFRQPFREDALSYLVPFAASRGGALPPVWTCFAAAGAAALLALWRCPRTPAGFAAGAALVFFAFFVTSKQAFCNYYALVLAALCCALAATPGIPCAKPRRP